MVLISPSTYQSYTTISKKASFNDSHFKLFKTYFSNQEVLYETTTKLENEFGVVVDSKTITSGLSFIELTDDSTNVTILFEHRKKAIVKPILSCLSDVAVKYITTKTDNDTRYIFTDLRISIPASEAIKNNKMGKTFIASFAIGAIISLFSSTIAEFLLDQVNDKNDIEVYGYTVTEIKI